MRILYIDTSSSYLYTGIVEDNELIASVKEELGQDLSRGALPKIAELFDENNYPIVVINELNSGGYTYLSQLFMGILSPLMPINLFKGRLRVTESLKDSNEVNNYINSNLTSINTCQKQTFKHLLKD